MDVYPFEEFLRDYDIVRPKVHEQAQPSFEGAIAICMRCMDEIYADRATSRFRLQRLMLIMQYLADRFQAFDKGDYFVYGSERVGALASEHLLKAIHHVFTRSMRLADLHDPSPIEIMKLADSFRESS